MKEILEKLLEDVDPDIRELLLKDSDTSEPSSFYYEEEIKGKTYKNWELLPDATLTALYWQLLRDNKK